MTECYMTQPDVLPETLPVGSVTKAGHVYKQGAKLVRSSLSFCYYLGVGCPYSAHDREIDWSTVPVEPVEPKAEWIPKRGELVTAAHWSGSGKLHTGKFEKLCEDSAFARINDESGVVDVTVASLRPAPATPSKDTSAVVITLPPGTRFRILEGGAVYEFVERAVLRNGSWHGACDMLEGREGKRVRQAAGPYHSDIIIHPSDAPLPEPAKPEAGRPDPAACGDCGAQALLTDYGACAYCAKRAAGAENKPSRSLDDRIAAAKRQTLESFDRPLVNLGGRYGRTVALEQSWPMAGEDEP